MAINRNRIVVGVDGSFTARAALVFALREAVRRQAEVYAVTTVEVPVDAVAVPDPTGEPDRLSAIRQRTVAAERTDRIVVEVRAELADELGAAPTVIVTAVFGTAAPVLLRAAEGAELLVVGHRERPASSPLGPVGRDCVLHAACPVMIVRTAHDRAETFIAP